MDIFEEAWRVGRKVGRTIYREAEGTEGEIIGLLDSREAARLASAAPDMYRALQQIEWGECETPAESKCCPACGAFKESAAGSRVHCAGCTLHAALKKARGEP